MWKLLALFCVAAVSQAKNLEDAAHLYGEYKTFYTWPKFDREVPNCSPLTISKTDVTFAPDSCKCGRDSANLAVVGMDVNSKKFNMLLDFVNNIDDLKLAKKDKCSCVNSDLHHDVVWKIDDNYMVHYDTNLARIYLLGKQTPSADQLKSLIDGFYWKDREGTQLCK